MKRSNNFRYKLFEFIRSLDQYGHPIAFKYKNSSTFKTSFGGIVTLFVRSLILAFLISEILKTETFDIRNQYNCPIDFKTAFYGQFSTQQASMLQVQVKKCNQTNLSIKNKNLTCASPSEIDFVVNYLTITILMTNQFIDVNQKYGNPIKTVLKQFFATAQSGLSLSYQLKIGENFLIQSTSSISNLLGQQNLTYYTITNDQFQIADIQDSGIFITCQLLLDDIVTTTNLELFTLSDALSNTGGIIGIISIIVQILVSSIQQHFYYQSLIKQQFQISSDLLEKQHLNVKIGQQNSANLELSSTTLDQNNEKAIKLGSLIDDLKN
ncbi:UNKNOWN [Stylonychia lemnae]|uniref:Transmembrane protein n=1 Tax=Stylonychia lemnae TaxID=5949 RepID=A0A078BCV6_STYLE|nr:UNKNOWN [Stylonychia lemnae]|eukprot:CDW91423.1 UNKNOWN [Stylonychia lemnae]